MRNDGVLGLPAHSDHEALANFIEGLKVAESAAKQMAFYTQTPQWLVVQSQLASTREICVKLAQVAFSKRLIT